MTKCLSNPVTKADKNHLEEHIKQELSKTKKQILELRQLTRPIAPDCAIGRVSRMDAINNKSINEATLRQAENKLSGLKYALDRIEESGFGICVKCERTIPFARIMLVPQSRFCANCAD